MPARGAISSSRFRAYLDANASALPEPFVCDGISHLLASAGFGANPSSAHALGRQAGAILRDTENLVRESLNLLPGWDVEWSASGSQSNLWAISGSLARGGVWWRTCLEHDSVRSVRPRGATIWELGALPSGQLDLSSLQRRLTTEKPTLLTVLWVHNETGSIQDLPKISELLRAASPETLLHVDATQAWGKIPLGPALACADWITLSGHKIGALAGIGMLLLSPRAQKSWQDRDWQTTGTKNSIGIASVGIALSKVPNLLAKQPSLAVARDRIENELMRKLDGVRIAGREGPRVANTSLIGFEGVRGRVVADRLDLEGFCAGTGSACRSDTPEASPSLLAMGWRSDLAKTATRLSYSQVLPPELESDLIAVIADAVGKARC